MAVQRRRFVDDLALEDQMAEEELSGEVVDDNQFAIGEDLGRFHRFGQSEQASAAQDRFVRKPETISGFTRATGMRSAGPTEAGMFGIDADRAALLTEDYGSGLGFTAGTMSPAYGIGPQHRDHEFQRDMRLKADRARESYIKEYGGGPQTFADLENFKGPMLPKIARVSEQEAVFRAYQMLPQEIRGDFPLNDPRRVAALARMGRVAPKEFERVSKMDPAAISEHIRDMQPSKGGGNFMSKVGKVVTMTGVGALMSAIPGMAGVVMPALLSAASTKAQGGSFMDAAKSGLMSGGLAGAGKLAAPYLGKLKGMLFNKGLQISPQSMTGLESMGLRGTQMALGGGVSNVGGFAAQQAALAGNLATGVATSGMLDKIKAFAKSPQAKAAQDVITKGGGELRSQMAQDEMRQMAQRPTAESSQQASLRTGELRNRSIFRRRDDFLRSLEPDLESEAQKGVV